MTYIDEHSKSLLGKGYCTLTGLARDLLTASAARRTNAAGWGEGKR